MCIIIKTKMEKQMSKDYISWEPKYEIGIPIIDEEHKTLVGIINKFYTFIIEEKSAPSSERRENVKTVLQECSAYTQTHFSHEEQLMKLCNYQDFQNHKYQHTLFIQKILQQVENFDSENYASSIDFAKFLMDWILSHIAFIDKLYVKTLKQFLIENPEITKNIKN